MSFAPWYGPGGAQGNLYPRHPWDQIKLADQIIPCHRAKITNASLALLADRKKALGKNGGHPTYHGINPQLVEIDVEFTTVEQLRDFAEMMAGIGPSLTSEPPPVPIEAQAIQHLGCLVTVKVVRVGAIEGESIKRCRLQCDHWLKPPAGVKSATSTPKKPVNNMVTEAAAAKANPKPSAQPGFCGSPNASAQPGA